MDKLRIKMSCFIGFVCFTGGTFHERFFFAFTLTRANRRWLAASQSQKKTSNARTMREKDHLSAEYIKFRTIALDSL